MGMNIIKTIFTFLATFVILVFMVLAHIID